MTPGRRLQSLFRRRRGNPILLHAHMFKNAGTTFDDSLQRYFGNAFLDHRDDEQMRRGADYLGPLLQQRDDLDALSSHWLALPPPQLPDRDIALAMFFRHPLERIGSVYRFERSQQVDHAGTRTARTSSMADYVCWRLEPGTGPVIRNYHCRYLSGDYFGSDEEQLFRRALQTLDASPLLGLVHRYHESIALFEYRLQPLFPHIDLAYRRQNRSEPAGISTLEQRLQAVAAELGELLPQVEEANRFDLQLYAHAEQQFERDLAEVPDLPRRLQELQRRCEALA